MVNHPPAPRETPDEADPTGVRALLSGLSDPGPMPPDLVERIRASIAAEQSVRHHSETVIPLARRRRRWQRAGLAAAAVAAVAVAVPALISTWGPSGAHTASSFSGGESAADSAAGGAAGLTPPVGTHTSPLAAPDHASKPLGDLRLQASGTAYSGTDLATQARPLTDTTKAAKVPDTSLAAAGVTASRLRDCLTGLGVETWAPVTGDLATFEGRPAVIAVVSSDTGQVVYAVAPSCDATHPLRLAGPIPLH